MGVDTHSVQYVRAGLRWLGPVVAISGAALFAGGCSRIFHSGASGSIAVHNQNTHRVISPEIVTGVYRSPGGDENTADIYLSDMPLERLASHSDHLKGMSGVLVHIHLFLIPSAGNTPIDQTACNVAVRTIVLASSDAESAPLIGVYSGGGFVLPSGDPGDSTFGGSILEASLRLIGSSSNAANGFVDQLTPAEMSGSFRSTLDEANTNALAARFERLASHAKVPPPPRPWMGTQPESGSEQTESSQTSAEENK